MMKVLLVVATKRGRRVKIRKDKTGTMTKHVQMEWDAT
jgi:hypothetical protein